MAGRLAGWQAGRLAGWLVCLPREHLAEEGAQEGPQEHLRVRRAHLIHAIVWCGVSGDLVGDHL